LIVVGRVGDDGVEEVVPPRQVGRGAVQDFGIFRLGMSGWDADEVRENFNYLPVQLPNVPVKMGERVSTSA
jgi:hypothetical protein